MTQNNKDFPNIPGLTAIPLDAKGLEKLLSGAMGGGGVASDASINQFIMSAQDYALEAVSRFAKHLAWRSQNIGDMPSEDVKNYTDSIRMVSIALAAIQSTLIEGAMMASMPKEQKSNTMGFSAKGHKSSHVNPVPSPLEEILDPIDKKA